MANSAEDSNLSNVPVALIDRNTENPRLLFRPEEMEQLLDSIDRLGVQVPIAVYKEGRRYVLIDGERRWLCCLKLNRKTIPALIQDKPGPLANLLLMFNIHALREQWDLLTIALKLPRVIDLLRSEYSKAPSEAQISEYTGLSRSMVRRSKLLMELPTEHQDAILTELKKPKSKQKLTEDFYIEMEKSLKTVENAMPGVIENKDEVRDVLIAKYRSGTIQNMVDLRKVGRIARAENVQADPKAARAALTKLFKPNRYGIGAAYDESVAGAYDERDILGKVDSMIHRLQDLDPAVLDDALVERLEELRGLLEQLLRAR